MNPSRANQTKKSVFEAPLVMLLANRFLPLKWDFQLPSAMKWRGVGGEDFNSPAASFSVLV